MTSVREQQQKSIEMSFAPLPPPPLLDPSLLFPSDWTLEPLQYSFDDNEQLCNEESDDLIAFEADASPTNVIGLQTRLELWLLQNTRGSSIDGKTLQRSQQFHWEETEQSTRSLYGKRLYLPMFRMFDLPYEPCHHSVLQALFHVSVGIQSNYFSWNSATKEFILKDRSIIYNGAFPFKSALHSLIVINEFCKLGTVMNELDLFVTKISESDETDFVALPIFLEIQKRLAIIRKSVFDDISAFMGKDNVCGWSQILNKIRPYFEPVYCLYYFFGLNDPLSDTDSVSMKSSLELLEGLFAAAETPRINEEITDLFVSLFECGFKAMLDVLEKWIYKGEINASSGLSFFVLKTMSSSSAISMNQFWNIVFQANPMFENSRLFGPFALRILEVGRKINVLKKLYADFDLFCNESVPPPRLADIYQSDLKISSLQSRFTMNKGSMAEKMELMEEPIIVRPSKHQMYVLEKQKEKNLLWNEKIKGAEKVASGLLDVIESRKEADMKIIQEEHARAAAFMKGEEKRARIVESLQRQMVDNHEREMKGLELQEYKLDKDLGLMTFPSNNKPIDFKVTGKDLPLLSETRNDTLIQEVKVSPSESPEIVVEELEIVGSAISMQSLQSAVNECRIEASEPMSSEEDSIKDFVNRIKTNAIDPVWSTTESRGCISLSFKVKRFLGKVLTVMESIVDNAYQLKMEGQSDWRNFLDCILDVCALKSPLFSVALLSHTSPFRSNVHFLQVVLDSLNGFVSTRKLKDQETFSMLSLSLENQPSSPHVIGYIDQLKLDWQLPDSLKIVFGETLMDQFQSLFRLLLKLKFTIEMLGKRSFGKEEGTTLETRQRLGIFLSLNFFRRYESFIFQVIGRMDGSKVTVSMIENAGDSVLGDVMKAAFLGLSLTPMRSLLQDMVSMAWTHDFKGFLESHKLFITILEKIIAKSSQNNTGSRLSKLLKPLLDSIK